MESPNKSILYLLFPDYDPQIDHQIPEKPSLQEARFYCKLAQNLSPIPCHSKIERGHR